MSMIDVKNARSVDELKRQTFVNFRQIEKKLEVVGTTVVNYDTGEVVAPSSPGGNIFDIVYVGSLNQWITYDEDGNLVLHDTHAGDVTLSQILDAVNLFWESGDAKGVWLTNAAGTSKRVGLMEDADGITYFNDEDEVE